MEEVITIHKCENGEEKYAIVFFRLNKFTWKNKINNLKIA